jgi:plastocyanin domain-containing protein
MIDNWGVKKGVSPGKVEEVQFTPDRPGNYRFYCPVKGIEGTLTVREPQTEQSRDVASTPASAKSEPIKQADATPQRPEPKKLKMLTDDEE